MSLMMDFGDNLHGITFTQVKMLFAIALRSRSIHSLKMCPHKIARKEEEERWRVTDKDTKEYTRAFTSAHT